MAQQTWTDTNFGVIFKPTHIDELQDAINAWENAYSITPTVWTDDEPTTATRIDALLFTELQDALDALKTLIGEGTFTWTTAAGYKFGDTAGVDGGDPLLKEVRDNMNTMQDQKCYQCDLCDTQGCTCNVSCNNDACDLCDATCNGYSVCTCDSSCNGDVCDQCNATCYGESCSCNYACYSQSCSCISTCYSQGCTCNYSCYSESCKGDSCNCVSTCYQQSCGCNATCYTHSCVLCNASCNQSYSCTCNSSCNNDACDQCNASCFGHSACSCDSSCDSDVCDQCDATCYQESCSQCDVSNYRYPWT